ncbi:MAG: fibronectin type III domain-containing protein [Bacteroidales bacterium]
MYKSVVPALLMVPVFLLGEGNLKLQAQDAGQEPLVIIADSTHQTVTGFGASLAYYEGWLNAHPNRADIYQAVFGDLGLDILRVRTAFEYDPDMVVRVQEYVEASEQVRGTPIPVYATSWGPPGYLKSNADRSNGGSLRYSIEQGAVRFDYEGFAHWWNGALDEYAAHGIYPRYISIQNEPGWSAPYESCLLSPAENINSTDTIAGYNKALDAVYDTLQTREQRPLVFGPESIGIGYNNVERYVDALDITKLDGISHHLYHGVDENDPYASTDFAKVGNAHPELPHFQTEYNRGDWFALAGLIYKSFHDEGVEAYLYWDLIWGESGGLITLEFPWDRNRWTDPTKGYIINREYYTFKQFAAFIHPGWKRTDLSFSADDGAALAFVSPAGDSLACVVINRSETDSLAVRMGLPGYLIRESGVYTTSETEECLYHGPLSDSLLVLAPRSIATVDMRLTVYDPAEDTISPAVPQNLQLTGQTPTSLSVAWEPSEDNIGVSGHLIYVDGEVHGSTGDTAMTIEGLFPATAYALNVSAMDDAGNESALSVTLETATLIMPDTDPPVVEATDTVYDDGMAGIEVSSSEPGMIYLVPEGTPAVMAQIREAALDSMDAATPGMLLFPLNGLSNGNYWVYASDTVMNISEPEVVTILGVGIRSMAMAPFSSYPNPFTVSTILRFSLDQSQRLELLVYDSRGQQVRRIPLGSFTAGEHRITFRRDGLPEGVYIYRLESGAGLSLTGRWIIQE